MAAIALLSVAHENGQCNRLADPEKLYIPGFKEILNKKLARKQIYLPGGDHFDYP